ncbi:MAG: hypothetical protein LBQ20_10615 [Rhodanobacter sp.]|jgi:general secretion pathway protein C|nr:hypothetical protein [Rhodanobacter sp.]
MLLRFSGIDHGRHSEAVALTCCVALAVLGLWLLARMVWSLVPRDDAWIESPLHTDGTALDATAPARSAADWHLFGTAMARPGASGAAASASSLILRGTVAQADPKKGVAVIAEAGNGERAFGVGDEVVSGVRLDAVYPGHVVVMRNGAQETLNLPRDTNLAPADIMRPTSGSASSRTRTTAPVAGRSADAPANSAANAQNIKAPGDWQQQVAQWRQNPDELMKRVQVIPVLEGGKLSGVRLSAGADTALLGQIGLRPDDVVTAVNGMPVDSFARGQQILSNLGSASAVRVTVLRDGKPIELNVALP